MSTNDTGKPKKKTGPKKDTRNRQGKATDEKILEFVDEFVQKNGRLPRNKEIVAGTGLKKDSVSKRLKKLPCPLEELMGSPVKVGWRAMVQKVFDDELAADRHDPKVLDWLWRMTNQGQGFPDQFEITGTPIPLVILDRKMKDNDDDELKEIISSRPGGTPNEPDED